MLVKTTTAETASNYRLTNFHVECKCGESHVLTSTNDTKTCKCGRIVSLSSSMKQKLIANGSAKPIN